MAKIGVILGDQLSNNIATLKYIDKKNDQVIMAEVRSEATYVKHHKHKIILVFSAMRHFAKELSDQGYKVKYIKYNDNKNTQSIKEEIIRITKETKIEQVIITKAGEYRLQKELESLQKIIDILFLEDDRFYSAQSSFNKWAHNRKELILEYFYRKLRQEHGILMHNNKPIGGKWNYDKENRKCYKNEVKINKNIHFAQDNITKDIIKIVDENFMDHIGSVDNFNYAVTREDAKKALNHFIENNLENYGKYQDAMVDGEHFLYHSLISPYLNIGLLCPKEVCKTIENCYYEGKAPLNSVEGFIRQILGWREFIRGIYWYYMPNYSDNNYLNHKNNLPKFYWNGETKLNCLKNSILSTIKHAYSHHIQRLMITGNFALLTQTDIKQIHQWYLAVYIDAFEWVEAPNTIGMSQYGDGGIVATKPYISGGSYINRMSNYCKNCFYNVKTIDQSDSCPFNFLYWNFLITHQDKFRKNHRMSIAYSNLDKMSKKKQKDIIEKSKYFINNLN